MLGILVLELYGVALDTKSDYRGQIPLEMDPSLKDFISQCLEPEPEKRASAILLLEHRLFDGMERPTICFNDSQIHPSNDSIDSLESFTPTYKQIFFLWNLLGGDPKRLVPELTSTHAPIFSIPTWIPMSADVEELVLQLQDRPKLPAEPKLVSLYPTWVEIAKLKSSLPVCQKVLEKYNDGWKYPTPFREDQLEQLWSIYNKKVLPLNCRVKERDMEYQFLRMFRFKSLLAAYPETAESICLEAIADIPPLQRGSLWACILGVTGDPETLYKPFNSGEVADTDRQLDLDIPRCHQYHDLLSTPQGQAKLKRVLKAWIKSEEGRQVYWQGLDSLAACFVTLNFHNEVKWLVDKRLWRF